MGWGETNLDLSLRAHGINAEPVGPDLSGKGPEHSTHFPRRDIAFPDKSGPTGFAFPTENAFQF